MKPLPNSKLTTLFVVCALLLFSCYSYAQKPRSGNGYENLTRRITGGKIRKGDTLDIKMAIHIPWGYNGGASGRIFSARFLDSIPSNTVLLAGAADSIRILTNEDSTYMRFTPAPGDDAATYIANPPTGNYQIRINLGLTGTAPFNNTLTNIAGAGNINLTSSFPYGDRPKWWTGHIFSTSYQVKVTGNTGDTIRLTGGLFIFRKTSGGVDSIITGVSYKMLIGSNDTLCQNSLGTNFAGEFGGTFGSGNTLNRNTGPSSLVPGYLYVNNVSGSGAISINDGSYGIVNNISPWSGTSRTARRTPNCSGGVIATQDSCKYRMFNGNWEIEGDHTGATNKYGNTPPSASTNSGYMLVVNADYITSDAYKQTVVNLCPNTFYQFSVWVRNICRTCGADNNLTNTYNPGVRPSLTFSVDNIDWYSTGKVDTTGWIKKAFLFKSGATQNNAVFTIRNNSQGGGGNDWALDDIEISTCGPDLRMNYNPFFGCNNGTLVNLSDTVRYTNPSYSWYKWEQSTDGGNTWVNPPTPTTGQLTPVLTNGVYQYITNYPAFLAYAADNGHKYRVIVATTLANLSNSNCTFNDGSSVVLNLITCTAVLGVNMISFTSALENGDLSAVKWVVSKESNILRYEIEKSFDGINFIKTGEKDSRNSNSPVQYIFIDGEKLTRNTYYRLKMIAYNGSHQYSKIVAINRASGFEVVSVINPVNNFVSAAVVMPDEGILKMNLFDNYGKLVARKTRKLHQGYNSVIYDDLSLLSGGIYIIVFESNGVSVRKKLTRLY